MENELIINSILWVLVAALYYLMGRSHGYSKGFQEGGLEGAQGILKILTDKATHSKVQGSSDEK